MKSRRLIIVIGVLVVLLLVCVALTSPGRPSEPAAVNTSAPGQAQPAAPTPAAVAIGKVGERITKGDYSLTVVQIETAQQYGDFNKAEAGKKFVAAELLIESGSDRGVSVNPLYVSLKDADGFEYNASLFGKEPMLGSQNDLPNGDKMRGWMTFEVPQAVKVLVLTYEPLVFGAEGRIRVDLGQ